jgi:hypothetical protein
LNLTCMRLDVLSAMTLDESAEQYLKHLRISGKGQKSSLKEIIKRHVLKLVQEYGRAEDHRYYTCRGCQRRKPTYQGTYRWLPTLLHVAEAEVA